MESMSFQEFSAILVDSCEKNGILQLSEGQIDVFWHFTEHFFKIKYRPTVTAAPITSQKKYQKLNMEIIIFKKSFAKL